jgi:hypothetical protein
MVALLVLNIDSPFKKLDIRVCFSKLGFLKNHVTANQAYYHSLSNKLIRANSNKYVYLFIQTNTCTIRKGNLY